MRLKFIIGVILLLTGTSLVFGQVEYPSLSPKGRIIQMVGNTSIEIEYERPSARDRKIFDGLVPWNKVWRTGAGHCTIISFNTPIVLGGQSIKAGKYSIFTIPNPNEWIVILNSDTTLYGSFNYNSKNDVARFIVTPSTTQRYYETLTFDIDLIPNNAKIYISWGNTQIDFELLTSTDEDLMNYIDEFLLTEKENDGSRYANAAEQLYFMNYRFRDALVLCEIALKKHKDVDEYSKGFVFRVKMDIYEKLHLYNEAIEAINQAIKLEANDSEVKHWMNNKRRITKKVENTHNKVYKE